MACRVSCPVSRFMSTAAHRLHSRASGSSVRFCSSGFSPASRPDRRVALQTTLRPDQQATARRRPFHLYTLQTSASATHSTSTCTTLTRHTSHPLLHQSSANLFLVTWPQLFPLSFLSAMDTSKVPSPPPPTPISHCPLPTPLLFITPLILSSLLHHHRLFPFYHPLLFFPSLISSCSPPSPLCPLPPFPSPCLPLTVGHVVRLHHTD